MWYGKRFTILPYSKSFEFSVGFALRAKDVQEIRYPKICSPVSHIPCVHEYYPIATWLPIYMRRKFDYSTVKHEATSFTPHYIDHRLDEQSKN